MAISRNATAQVRGWTNDPATPQTYPRRRIPAGASWRTLERRERFDVMSVGEEVEEVERAESPTRRGQPARVAGEGYGIARQEANALVRLVRDRVDHVSLRARARRIEEDEVGARHVVDPRFDRCVDQFHVLRRIHLRALMRSARPFDRRDALERLRQRR